MPNIGGEKLRLFNEYYNQCLKLLNEHKYNEELLMLLDCWSLIPNDKYYYDESYIVAWRVVQLAIETNNIPLMNEWKNHIALADPERADSGHREMLLGKIAYMNNNLQEARELFHIADKKSEGRCFNAADSKYIDFMSGKESELKGTNSDSNAYSDNDELDDDLYKLITSYCEEGDRLFDDGLFDEALLEYDSAWDLLPEPKLKWDAASWIYAAKGDVYFFKGDYSDALPFFRDLYNQFEMINEFVLIRYGQCLYESGQTEEGKRFIFEAYMLGGKELFIHENAKYYTLIESWNDGTNENGNVTK